MIKTFNGDAKPESLRALLRAVGDRSDVHVIDRFLSVEEKNALLAARGLLRLAAPLGGLRPLARGGDAARQARRRHGLLRQPPVHDAGELVAGGLRADHWSARARSIYPPTRVGGPRPRPRRRAAARGPRGRGRRASSGPSAGAATSLASLSPERTGAAVRARLERLLALASPATPPPGSARAALTLQAAREKTADDPSDRRGRGDLPRKGAARRASRTAIKRELNEPPRRRARGAGAPASTSSTRRCAEASTGSPPHAVRASPPSGASRSFSGGSPRREDTA